MQGVYPTVNDRSPMSQNLGNPVQVMEDLKLDQEYHNAWAIDIVVQVNTAESY